MAIKYETIFFDLDRTIWDFEANAKDSFKDMYLKYKLASEIPSFEYFYTTYRQHNDKLWKNYREKKITKEKLSWYRFFLTLLDFDVDNPELAQKLGVDYLKISQTKQQLFPYTHEVLSYLKGKYTMHIITNGFEEVQFSKLTNCKLNQYFSKIITSEKAGFQKPKPEIFNYALEYTNARVETSIMIGDDMEVDIKGAKGVGMDQVHFNFIERQYDSKATFNITSLLELKDFL